MQKYFLDPAYPSFKIKNLRGYVTTIYIIKGFLIATLLSLFIYLHYFGLKNELFLQIVTTISALSAFFMLLRCERQSLFWAGVFTALFWFYWVPFSFRYYDLTYLIPLLSLFFSLVYGLIFWMIGLFAPSVVIDCDQP